VEVNQKQRRLIMSERRAVREWRATHKRELLTDLNEGDVRTGTVSSVADFGVFVDLGGADGLVHVSELTHERGRHPKEIVKVGQTVEVYVLSLDREKKRIGLSMKRLQPDPWSKVEDDHYIGQICDARITNLSKFGAFARLPSGLEGLIHLSEISDELLESPGEAVRPGQDVTVEILSIDPERQRIGLSMRRVPEHLRTAHPQPTGSDRDDSGEDAEASHFEPSEGTADEPDTGATDASPNAGPEGAEPSDTTLSTDDDAVAREGSDVIADQGGDGAVAEDRPAADESESVDGNSAADDDSNETSEHDDEAVASRSIDGSTEDDR
jgi:small subunit ribosomal protein S1